MDRHAAGRNDVERNDVAIINPCDEKEKERSTRAALTPNAHDELLTSEGPPATNSRLRRAWVRFERQLVAYNLEARGIQRVEPHERQDLRALGYSQVAIMWFSVNLAANNITLGMLARLFFRWDFWIAVC